MNLKVFMLSGVALILAVTYAANGTDEHRSFGSNRWLEKERDATTHAKGLAVPNSTGNKPLMRNRCATPRAAENHHTVSSHFLSTVPKTQAPGNAAAQGPRSNAVGTAGSSFNGMNFYFALGEIESGNNDAAVGASGEVSRYQIMPAVWQQYTRLPVGAARNPFTARNVAQAVMEARARFYLQKESSNLSPQQFYILWHRPAVFMKHGRCVTWVEFDRAVRFENLVCVKSVAPRDY